MGDGEQVNQLTEAIDRLRRGENSPGSAWLTLAGAMVVSVLVALWFGRDAWFSLDELTWLSTSSELDLSDALEPHVGHLVLVPKLVYRLALETIGPEYLTFRLLTTASVLLCAALFFIWSRRRAPDFVVLAGCFVILLFPSDSWHLLGGNGFTVMFALACGLAALIAWDRQDFPGDVAAFAFLLLGIATYTVALPFAVGLAAVSILERSGRHRLWVSLVPVALYLLWRMSAGVGGTDPASGGTDWTNLVLLPAWTFESLGTILAAIAGLNFDFTRGATIPPGTGVAPVLAVVALAAFAWRVSRGQTGPMFWGIVVTILALFAAQTLGWGVFGRGPGAARYLYPGLILVLLIGVESIRGARWGRTAFLILWIVTGASMLTAFGLLKEGTDWLATERERAKVEITAVTLLDSTGRPTSPARQPRDILKDEYDSVGGGAYGYLGYDPSTLRGRAGRISNRVDAFLSQSLSLQLAPVPSSARLGNCRPARPAEGRFRLDLPPDGAVLKASLVSLVKLGRFGSGTIVGLGKVAPGYPQLLALYPDSDPTPWFVTTREPGLLGCSLVGG
jgi:hypothetical protein